MPDPTFETFTTQELAAFPIGKRMLDRHGTVWTKKVKYGREYWDSILLSTGKRPKDANPFRAHSYMARRMLSHYTGPVAQQITKARKEQ